jgi:hypothetical protein
MAETASRGKCTWAHFSFGHRDEVPVQKLTKHGVRIPDTTGRISYDQRVTIIASRESGIWVNNLKKFKSSTIHLTSVITRIQA